MRLSPTRLYEGALLHVLTATCGLLLFASTTSPARGQCNPHELFKLTGSDAAVDDRFGNSVAVSGDTMVIGARFDDNTGGTDAGSAYVFVRSGSSWSEQAKLIALDAEANDHFGHSVAVSGDTVFVGARWDNHSGGTDSGSVYVFVRNGLVWTQQQKLVASDAAPFDWFGYSVAVSGDTSVIGAYQDDNTAGTNAGSAYVFVRTGMAWAEQAKLTATDALPYDQFGSSVAVEGDNALVGVEFDVHGSGWGGIQGEGSVYAFVRSSGIWMQQAKLTASDAVEGDAFGCSVALAGETALVGAYYDDLDGGPGGIGGEGSAYAFVRSGTIWVQQAKLSGSDAGPGNYFGYSVAIHGDSAVVGSQGDDSPGISSHGSAAVFIRTGGVWTQEAKLSASDATDLDSFGCAVALSGNIAVVGALYNNNSGANNAGSAYVFDFGDVTDNDGIPGFDDNCPLQFNSNQADADGDCVGDVCDVCPNTSSGLPVDCDGRPLRDANNDCLVTTADVPFIVNELLLVAIQPTGCNGQPLRDANRDSSVNAKDIKVIVKELLIP